MPVQSPFGRRPTYRAYGANGELLASEDLGSDQEAVAWARRLVRQGISVERLNREISVGFEIDVPLV